MLKWKNTICRFEVACIEVHYSMQHRPEILLLCTCTYDVRRHHIIFYIYSNLCHCLCLSPSLPRNLRVAYSNSIYFEMNKFKKQMFESRKRFEHDKRTTNHQLINKQIINMLIIFLSFFSFRIDSLANVNNHSICHQNVYLTTIKCRHRMGGSDSRRCQREKRMKLKS